MSVLQIVLLVIGVALFVVSFFVADGRDKNDKTSYLAEREIQSTAQSTLNEAGDKLSEMVEETVQYAMEKSERGLERISNEKIMAVSEYSNSVMADMEKSHKEILFLYDMLNEKTTALKNSIREADELRKNIDKANEALKNDMTAIATPEVVTTEAKVPSVSEEERLDGIGEQIIKQTEEMVTPALVNTAIPDIYGGDANNNKNDKILSMHAEGKSNVAIAKELGLGVGEVKLVIDLFKGAK